MARMAQVSFLIAIVLLAASGADGQVPRTMGLLYHDTAATAPGYTLFAPMPYSVTYLIDNDGMKVHSWPGFYSPGLSVNLCESGLLLRTCYVGNSTFPGGGAGGRVELVDWDGTVVWSYNYSSTSVCQHHDAIMLPSGNVLMIAWEYKNRTQSLDAGRKPDLLYYNCLWPDHLIEVNPASNSIVWEWHVWDHLVQNYDPTKPNYGDPAAHPELIDINFVNGVPVADWNHSNTVAYNPELDQIAISVRQLSEVWVIDHSTTSAEAAGHTGGRYGRGGDLLYRWGNPPAYGRGSTIGQTLYGQHDIQWIPTGLPGAGNMLVFNNGLWRTPTPYSSVDEFAPPQDSAGFYHIGPDSAYGPAAPVWQYVSPHSDSFYSELISGCQRLPNGNTIICSGVPGTFIEVDSTGRTVWKYICPVTSNGPQEQGQLLSRGSNQVFKVRKYAPDYPGLAGRRLDPLGPIETYPQATSEPPSSDPYRSLLAARAITRGRVLLELNLAAAAPVKVTVLDPTGRTVALVAEQVLPAGQHRFEWSLAGRAPGTYFALARAGKQTARARFICLSRS